MKLTIRARHLELTPETHDAIRHRIESAFRRLSPWIRSVAVTLTDLNGPKGGADKHCRVRARGSSMASVVVDQVGVDIHATVSLAAERAKQAVLRKVVRRRSFAPQLAA